MPSLEDIVAGASNEEVELDLSGSVDFDPVPDGDYVADILDVEPGVSKEKADGSGGNPKLAWTFIVVEPEAHAGRQLMKHTPLVGKGAGLTKQVLKALGVDVSEEKLKFNPSKAKGQRVTLTVGTQKGTDFNEVKKVKPGPDADPLA